MKRQTNRSHEKVNANPQATQGSAPQELTEDQLEQVTGGAEELPAVQNKFQKIVVTFQKISS
jgi:bacteriocin-like protein